MSPHVLSWNIAQLEVSADAPSGWDIDYTQDAIRRFILRLKPDLICLQEVPTDVPFVEGYELLPKQTESHCGYVATLIREDVASANLSHDVVRRSAVLTHFPTWALTIANVHLAPWNSGRQERIRSLKEITNQSKTERLVVIGDTNTRVDEEDAIAELGLAADRPPDSTWDTRRNRFRSDSNAYSAYYTRYFCRGEVRMTDVRVWDTPLQVDGQKFFLSDHFAMSGRIEYNPSST